MNSRLISFLLVAISISVFSCKEKPSNKTEETLENRASLINEITVPFVKSGLVPNLHLGKNNKVYLTWIETSENSTSQLYFSTLNNNKWETPTKICEGDNWVVNWADFPSLTQFNKNLAINLLVETDPENYAYDVHLALSNDEGKTWQNSFKPHTDNTKTEHGFVSLLPYQDSLLMTIWLDGRKYSSGEDEMSLRAAVIDKNGKTKKEFILDERVCDCCATDAVLVNNIPVIVYRNREQNEKRDISFIYYKDAKWSQPKTIANDNWIIAGCPVNGPSIDAYADKISVAWFTSANDIPQVKFSFAGNLESPFSTPITINSSATIGRVDVCAIDEQTSVVSWLEEEQEQTYLKIRTIKTDGSSNMGKPITIAKIDAGRSGGFPKMIKKDEQLLFAWTETSQKSKIKTAIIELKNL